MAHLKKYVTHKVTKPFIQNVRVPGQDEPGLTFKVGGSNKQSKLPTNEIASVHVLASVMRMLLGGCFDSWCEQVWSHRSPWRCVAACVFALLHVSPCVQVSSSDPPELRLLRPLVLEAAGFLGYTQAMNTAGVRRGWLHDCPVTTAARSVLCLAAP